MSDITDRSEQGRVNHRCAGTEHHSGNCKLVKFIEQSDCLFRVPGESVGADMEVAHAANVGVPVFTDIRELYAEMETTQE